MAGPGRKAGASLRLGGEGWTEAQLPEWWETAVRSGGDFSSPAWGCKLGPSQWVLGVDSTSWSLTMWCRACPGQGLSAALLGLRQMKCELLFLASRGSVPAHL